MNAVTVGTHRGVHVSDSHSFAVNRLHECGFLRLVTFRAGVGDIRFEDRRGRVARRTNIVRTVTVAANRRFPAATRDGFAVNAVLIGIERSRADAGVLHHGSFPVAGTAGLGNVDVAYTRVGIASRENFVDRSETIDATRRLTDSRLKGLGVEATVILFLFLGMARRTSGLGRRDRVRDILNIGVAVDALEYLAVDRSREPFLIDGKADHVTVLVLHQRWIVMAGETVVVRELGFGRGLLLREPR